MRARSLWFRPRLVACLALFALALPAARAAGPEKRVAAAVCVTETASLLRREAPDSPWQVVKEGQELFSGDLTLGTIGGAVDARDGGVRLAVVGDADGTAPLPVLETAFVLHEAKGVDLDFTLDRGRVRLINLKKEGAARVRWHVGERSGEVILAEPGATLSAEIYGRWPRGVPFRKEPKPDEKPALAFVLLAVKGEVELKGPERRLMLKAPPGLALLEGDSLSDPAPDVSFVKELPDWCPERLCDLDGSKRGQQIAASLARFRRTAATKSIDAALDGLINSDDEADRRVAVMLLAALDDPRIADVLRDTKHQDVWDAGIIALRNWIGRGPGQDQKLYQGLLDKAKMPPREAEAVMQLLHSFGDEDLAQPETYHVLISYLDSERPSMRELAYWHLSRLVPAGKKFGYEPLAPKEKRAAAVKEWHKLIPAGEMPPKPAAK